MIRYIVCLFLFSAEVIFAADSTRVRYLGIEHGLSNNAVTCIYKDHQGFMWFGTYDGLNQYNGYGFTVFRNIIGQESSLNNNHIYIIEEDAGYNLWMGTEKGISIYSPIHSSFSQRRFTTNTGGPLQYIKEGVHAIKCIGDHSVLCGTDDNGLIVFQQNEPVGRQIPLPGTGHGNAYTVSTIEFDSLFQKVWVFIDQLGLYTYDQKSQTLHLQSSLITQANCLETDQLGNLWLGSENGLFKYDISKKTYSGNLMPQKNRVMNIFEDKKGTLWIASDGGGVWFKEISFLLPKPYTSTTGRQVVNSNAVYDIYEDFEGRKWIGTLRGGVNIIEPQKNHFKLISYTGLGENNPVNNFILSFCEDEKNNVWIGTDGAGLRYWDRRKNTFTSYVHDPNASSSISSNFITSITKDCKNEIWIATWFGGINRFNRKSGTFETFSCYNPISKAKENNVWMIFEDRQHELWASATNNGSLYRFNRDAQQFELFDPAITNLQSITEDKDGSLWAGNYSALFQINRLQKTPRSWDVGYTVRSILEDKSNRFWIGTDGGGLLLFNKSKGNFKRFTTTDGLPNNTILRILEDQKGNLWLSTYNGICKFNPDQNTYRNYSQSDGLQSNQFSFNAALALQSGEFLFGGIKGFNIFYPDSIYDRKKMPEVFLTDLKIDNTTADANDSYIHQTGAGQSKEIKLPFSKSSLSIDFVALEYNGADQVRYAYQMEGWDKDWNYVNVLRTANYSRLNEGHYVFKVKVKNADGMWSAGTTLLKVTVLPPLYRTWWAYSLYSIFLITLIFLYLQYGKRQERLRYEIKLAHLEQQKEKEMTEKKISFFTHIAHEFRTPLTLIISPLKELVTGKNQANTRTEISSVYRNARRLLSLTDQLLLFRKAESIDQQLNVEHFDLSEACNEVFMSFHQHAISRDISLSFEGGEQSILIYGDKEKIEIILFNLMSNSFKYTDRGGFIKIIIEEVEQSVNIIVKDNGCGIAQGTEEKLFESFYQSEKKDKSSKPGFGIGLYVSQKLAIAHSGKISYTSNPGKLTEFKLELPKGKLHFSSLTISEEYNERPTILDELIEEPISEFGINGTTENIAKDASVIDRLQSALPLMIVVDDNADIRNYLCKIFSETYNIYEAGDGAEGYDLVVKHGPDIVISDVMMKNVNGIELCNKIKSNPALAHIPVILLTGSSSEESRLKGIEGGAEDYLTKPFDREIVVARVKSILKGRNRLRDYFFNAVTLKPQVNIVGEHKEFIEKCIAVVEAHLDDPNFTIPVFCREIGMSHPSLYKKVKTVSGLTVNVFIRYLRLRKAAELLINTDKTIVEVTYITGFNDIRYFREQFFRLFEINPSEYVKRYRKVMGNKPIP